MTLQELNEHYELRQKLGRAQQILIALYASAGPGAQVLTGMPHGSGVSDKVGDLAIEIADMAAKVEYLQRQVADKEKEISAYIDAIQDDQIRMIFRLRFVRCLTWGEVAGVIGGHNSEDGVKSLCYRYLKSCNAVTPRDAL